MKAVIFDMDGVISDTQQVNSELEALHLRKYGIEMSVEEMVREYAGIPERDFAEFVFKKYSKQVDLDAFVDEKLADLVVFCRGRVKSIEGSVELINSLKDAGFKLAVASSSKIDFVEMVLSELGVKDKFDVLTSGYEVEKGKPSPDIFLLTAKRLGVPASECIVIEDGKSGVIAAKRAGMKCIWLTDRGENKADEFSADIKISSLNDLQLSDFA